MNNPYVIASIFFSLGDKFFYISFSVLFVIFYMLIGLLTCSIIKPLKYMGIVNVIVGFIFSILKLLPYSIKVLTGNNLLAMILPSIIKPLFITGIIFFISGILMIVLYKLLKNKNKKNTE